ncbi:MAG: hypothetical protein Q8O62_09375 [Aequorivita sp.]|nr:hypothetical protein [Aequorivita sp.]
MLYASEKKYSEQRAYKICGYIKNICASGSSKQALQYLNYYAIKQDRN